MNDEYTFPMEIRDAISRQLTTRDLINFIKTSRNNRSLFKPLLDVRKLLHHVVCGEYEAMQVLLQENETLIFKKDTITDPSGRTFENISPFEYALWALDKHMWTSMLQYIPKGSKIVENLLSQYNTISTKGITYTLKQNTITEKHFNFDTIINAFNEQVKLVRLKFASSTDWDVIDRQWVNEVGSAQILLPAHVIYEYCSSKHFGKQTDFSVQPELIKQFFNPRTQEYENWLASDSKIGIIFALYKGRNNRCEAHHESRKYLGCENDLQAIKKLSEVRKKDFEDLKGQLLEKHQSPAILSESSNQIGALPHI